MHVLVQTPSTLQIYNGSLTMYASILSSKLIMRAYMQFLQVTFDLATQFDLSVKVSLLQL